jgi:hypothetical protein
LTRATVEFELGNLRSRGHSVGAGKTVREDCMRGIRHCLIAACCYGLLWAPAWASGDDWPAKQSEWEVADSFDPRSFDSREQDLEMIREQARDPYPVHIEDLGDLDGPFASQFPDLPPDVNPFNHAIETDRAAFTPAISTAPIGRMILESGYSFIANRHLPSEHSFPELMLRFGLSERIELRFGWNHEVGGGGSIVSPVQVQQGLVSAPSNLNGLAYENGFLYGTKLRLIYQSGWIPANTVIIQGFSPSFGDTKKSQVQATYAFGWELAPRWRLDAAVRYATEAELKDTWATWSPSVVFKAPFAERWTATAEYFAVIPQGQVGGLPQHFTGSGLQFLVTPDAQLNLRIGNGWGSNSPEFYLSAGFGLAF